MNWNAPRQSFLPWHSASKPKTLTRAATVSGWRSIPCSWASTRGCPRKKSALRRAGFLHDIGKVAIPDHILLKAGPLTSEEDLILREHPCTGEQICAPLKSFRAVLPIIRHHHEKMDG